MKPEVHASPSVMLVVFTLDGQKFALQLDCVERVVHAVEITPLPQAPDIVAGIVNAQGRVIPVVNARRRFRLPERESELSDRLMILQTARRVVGMAVDAVSGVIECPLQKIIASDKILPGIEYVKGVVKLDDGMIFIHDIDGFLSLEEEKALGEACGKLKNAETALGKIIETW